MEKTFALWLTVMLLIISSSGFAEEYKFDPSEIDKKPYYIGGYLEFRPDLLVLDKNAALHKLKFALHSLI